MRVAVVALGDLGRSPRMLYHSLALANEQVDVILAGYGGSEIRADVREHPRIHVQLLQLRTESSPTVSRGIQFLTGAATKALVMSVRLMRLLATGARSDVLLVQNPPAIPTLAVAVIAARLRGARLVIDWHNFGHAMLALRLGPRHPAVKLARLFEYRVGRLASAHLCVSTAMQETLKREAGIEAVVSRDRPASVFKPAPPAERLELLSRLIRTQAIPEDVLPPTNGHPRPAIVVTATSWSADEDVMLLLDAVRLWDAERNIAEAGVGPRLCVIVTGRGPLRQRFEEALLTLELTHASIHTLWLEPDDYPRLLGAADLGVSLHRSASGVDLPMKIADMFGAGLPVCALDYGVTIREQVQEGVNGVLFRTARELATHWHALFEDFPTHCPQLDAMRQRVAHESNWRWDDEWRLRAKPLLLS